MELYIYDQALNLLGIIDEITALVWTRRYWSCGEFSLLLPMTDRHAKLIRNGRLIIRKDADEAGQIQYIHIDSDQNGLEQIEVQGRFLTQWIGNRIIEPRIVMSAGTHEVLKTIVHDNLVNPADVRRRIPNLGIADTGALDLATVSYASDEFAYALDECEARAKLAKLGFKITTDVTAKQHSFFVYKGLDRTSSQTANPICIFSHEFDNVLTQAYTASVENVASSMIVAGAQPQDAARMWVEVSDDSRTGIDRVECFYDASDLAQTYTKDGIEQTIPDDEYLRLLSSRGDSALAQKEPHIAFSSSIDTHAGHVYRRDYDVGDRVTCVNRRWHITIDVRITEITESYESGKHELSVVFGESIPTLNEQIRWR